DGRHVALFYGVNNLDLRVWDLRNRSIVLNTTGIRGRCFAFSADNHLFALGQHNGPILVYDFPSGRCAHQLKQGPLPYALSFSPDGRRLGVSVPESSTVDVRDIETGASRSLIHPKLVLRLAWHPAGNLLATGCSDNNVWIWDVATGTRRSLLEGHQAPV